MLTERPKVAPSALLICRPAHSSSHSSSRPASPASGDCSPQSSQQCLPVPVVLHAQYQGLQHIALAAAAGDTRVQVHTSEPECGSKQQVQRPSPFSSAPQQLPGNCPPQHKQPPSPLAARGLPRPLAHFDSAPQAATQRSQHEALLKSVSVPELLQHRGWYLAGGSPTHQMLLQRQQRQQQQQQQPQPQQQPLRPLERQRVATHSESLAEVSAMRRTTAMLLRRMLRLELQMQAQLDQPAGAAAAHLLPSARAEQQRLSGEVEFQSGCVRRHMEALAASARPAAQACRSISPAASAVCAGAGEEAAPLRAAAEMGSRATPPRDRPDLQQALQQQQQGQSATKPVTHRLVDGQLNRRGEAHQNRQRATPQPPSPQLSCLPAQALPAQRQAALLQVLLQRQQTPPPQQQASQKRPQQHAAAADFADIEHLKRQLAMLVGTLPLDQEAHTDRPLKRLRRADTQDQEPAVLRKQPGPLQRSPQAQDAAAQAAATALDGGLGSLALAPSAPPGPDHQARLQSGDAAQLLGPSEPAEQATRSASQPPPPTALQSQQQHWCSAAKRVLQQPAAEDPDWVVRAAHQLPPALRWW